MLQLQVPYFTHTTGGIGRHSLGDVIFLFSMYKGQQTNNFMEALLFSLCLKEDELLDGARLFVNLILKLLWIC